ncbi:exocyst complex component SEC8 [Pyrus x bretschneideri]|uniref:exocyst complex component SEC8 n=1 Tax=Pyrus x bretschneideri TaxID=225117 RepID=UPI0020308D61|nr:exocyst complex component SEC8 [Pyrus x bretschneideri]XP_009368921.2 exocyst complex component SEC8 [Pyrus x bretschneideri]XP_018505676.2 exocyst complex component SEC8 [Pyrus x bretschneideri]
MGLFDGLPVSSDKAYLREEIAKIDESWAAARFDSLPHVVHILTSKDREGDIQALKEQSDVVEEVVDEVVHNYHSGFNKAIQNYSQILRLFSESTESVGVLKVDLAEAKKRLSARSKQLHQLWYRSVTLRHIISLLDQIEGISKVPARIEKLIAEKQYYAAVQFHVQSMLMLEREGLQTVGALQDVRSELTKLRGVLFHKVLEDLHAHLYNKGEYGSDALSLQELDDEVPTTTAAVLTNSQSLSRRTRLLKGDNQFSIQGDGSYRTGSIDGGSSFDGVDEEVTLELHEEATSDGQTSVRVNGDVKIVPREMPTWLQYSTPDEFLEAIKKSAAPLHVKYLQTMVECLCMLRKVAAAGAIICQRLRPTIHEIITSKIKAHGELANSSRSGIGQASRTTAGLHFMKGQLQSYQLPKQKRQNGILLSGTLLAVSPVSSVMAPAGKAQAMAKELLDSILDAVVRIFENHVVVGELLESKSSVQIDMNTPKSMPTDVNWNTDLEASQVTGGYSIGFSLTVLQSECQQLICEILRATPEAASADAAVQTARLANKVPSKDKRDDAEGGLTFAFRFTDATISVPNQGVDLIRQGWSRKGPNVSQEGYGSAAILPEQGIYLAASVYRPVIQFTDKVASMLPKKYSQLGNDGLLAFVENFVKDHFLPTMFVDYRKGVQQAISSPAAFRPRAHAAASYTPSVEKGRPVLQGLLAIDFLAKEVLGWAQAMPKFAIDLVKYVQTFLERTYERCRTSYMEAVLEKQSYMLIGRYDIEQLMRLDPASTCLPISLGQSNIETHASDSENLEVELQLSDLLLNLRPIKQDNLIRDDNKLILLASLSDSLEYVADSIERLGQTTFRSPNEVEESGTNRHQRTTSAASRDLVSFADEYRKLAIDCLKVLRVEMQLETIFHMQEMTNREYMEDQDAEEPDDFIISLTAQITRRDEEMAPFVVGMKRNYIFGGICSIAANASIKALADMKSINLFGVQQICRNSIALEQALAAIPSINSEGVQQRLDHVRTYYELLNMPFEALLAFITEHEHLFTTTEYANLLKVQVPGREIPADAQDRVSEILSR